MKMSRNYNSVDLPRTSSPFTLREAVDAALSSYASEDERDIVPRTSKPSRRRTTATIPSESLVTTVKDAPPPKTDDVVHTLSKSAASTATSAVPNTDIVALSPQNTRNEPIGYAFGLSHVPETEYFEYVVWNASVSNMRVCPTDLTTSSPTYYYIENRSFIPSRPGVTLHLGNDKTAPTVAVAHLDYFSTKNLLGLGSPETNPLGMKWEKLHRESFWTHMRYAFTFDFGNGEGEATRFGDHSGVRKFEWHRTKHVYWILDQPDLVLIEEGTLDVYAEYKGNNIAQAQKRRGTLKVKKGLGEGWERMVILAWASIVELHRRRTRERRLTAMFGKII
jgi:hypothetical protein